MSDQEKIIKSLTRRVEQLEQNDLSNFARLMDGRGGRGWVIDQGFAMAILSAVPTGFSAPTGGTPLIDPNERARVPKFGDRVECGGSEQTVVSHTEDSDGDWLLMEVNPEHGWIHHFAKRHEFRILDPVTP